jgi:putative restriction endonuclease
MADPDWPIRIAAFDFLKTQNEAFGEALPRPLLEAGFEYQGRRVPLLGPQGIFKPAVMVDMPLSITTTAPVPGRPAPYDDELGEGGVIDYKYRRGDPEHRENRGLRRAKETGTPLIYFRGLMPGYYIAGYPAYVIGDDRPSETFRIQVDEAYILMPEPNPSKITEARRAYVTTLIRRRVHQASFRQRVIAAYNEICAVCRLRHRELLDAAHILPDTHPKGEPIVPNGLSLCKLHHAAFDHNIIGIRPDRVIEINTQVLAEIDGPMLVHGLQGFHNERIAVPKSSRLQPHAELLEERYELFRSAG